MLSGIHDRRLNAIDREGVNVPGFLCSVVGTFRMKTHVASGRFTPFAFVALYYAVLNSTIVTLRQRGIRWRDALYPQEMLRAGDVLESSLGGRSVIEKIASSRPLP
jgi:hypothetical protein